MANELRTTKEIPYEMKFMVNVPILFIEEIESMIKEVKEKRGLVLSRSTILYQLAMDMKSNKIYIEPEVIRFAMKDYLKLDDNQKQRLKRVNKQYATV